MGKAGERKRGRKGTGSGSTKEMERRSESEKDNKDRKRLSLCRHSLGSLASIFCLSFHQVSGMTGMALVMCGRPCGAIDIYSGTERAQGGRGSKLLLISCLSTTKGCSLSLPRLYCAGRVEYITFFLQLRLFSPLESLPCFVSSPKCLA